MIEPAAFALFLLASLALVWTPGPDMALVIARALGGGARDGVLVTAGLIFGIAMHATLVAIGLAALFAASMLAFSVMKYLGAAYLIWLGVQALRARAASLDEGATSRHYSARALVAQGFLSSALNPKLALFFLAFLPQFADGQRAPLGMQIALLGAAFAALGFSNYALLALLVGRSRRLFATAWRTAMTRISGAVMIAAGARLAFAER